jgi:soluble lytic murein transglycosylase
MKPGYAGLVVVAAAASIACADRASGGDVDLSHATPAPFLQGDPLARRGDSLVRAGRPWRATTLLSARLATPATATPQLRLAGARAAAGWEGWSEVERLLRGATWLDRQFGGEGRELLARSELERGTDALADATIALTNASDDASRATRRVLLARAYDRANARDSAAAYYLAAAARLPRVADWLRLRAAGVTEDSAGRAAIFSRVGSPVARARITATDAQARERAGDFDGAARVFRKAGAEGSAFRVEALAARDDASRFALVQRIVNHLRMSPNNAEARQTLEVLDKLGPLLPRDELVVARAAAAAGVPARAVAGFARAAAASPLSPADRMSYAATLARAGKPSDALRVYTTITEDAALAPLAEYQRARLLVLTGDGASGRSALRAMAQQHAAIREVAAPALLLLADLQVDDGDLAGASQSLRELITRYSTAPQAPLARFRSGLLDWESSPAVAAAAFDSLAALHPSDEEAVAARYWAGRAYEKAGKKNEAESRWQGIIRQVPLSYYAMRAAERLHTNPWTPPAGSDTAVHVAGVDSAVQRIGVLRKLGMDVEARFEIDALADRTERAPTEAPAVAQALLEVGEPSRGVRVALAAIDRGNAARSLYRVAYPVLHGDALVEEAKKNGLDPAIVAGLIRQESSWNPRAVSPAAARGLMQLLPSVGGSIAASHRYPLWSPALLFDADVSIELGTAHLSSSLRRDAPPERALAAYNAGGSRVARWGHRPGADDPELFTEWIPFTETRDYVRLVLRNAAVYRALYDMQ